MKKYLKDVVLVVVTAIIASGVGVAAYNYNANNIEYSPSDKTWKVSTVAEAINSLVNDTRGSVMNYSLDEQVVGTWIDGKPIYQKTFTGTVANGNIIKMEPNLNVISYTGYAIYNNKYYPINAPSNVADLTHFMAVLYDTSGNINFFIQGPFVGSPYYLTIQYTKPDSNNS